MQSLICTTIIIWSKHHIGSKIWQWRISNYRPGPLWRGTRNIFLWNWDILPKFRSLCWRHGGLVPSKKSWHTCNIQLGPLLIGNQWRGCGLGGYFIQMDTAHTLAANLGIQDISKFQVDLQQLVPVAWVQLQSSGDFNGLDPLRIKVSDM